ncbi:hypothetical protein BDU57DRAFT_516469 [Ampelomyces quisqualis]|uniref:Uncharacterized protein n=1 Tax=Ampelomyces quisqualis TaxID=50730 RepID=A0A6A5QM06_AMPQU|nr:hypothetical protein BDU57DRAFT_516469 [Ampelomyces quisqualis]
MTCSRIGTGCMTMRHKPVHDLQAYQKRPSDERSLFAIPMVIISMIWTAVTSSST